MEPQPTHANRSEPRQVLSEGGIVFAPEFLRVTKRRGRGVRRVTRPSQRTRLEQSITGSVDDSNPCVVWSLAFRQSWSYIAHGEASREPKSSCASRCHVRTCSSSSHQRLRQTVHCCAGLPKQSGTPRVQHVNTHSRTPLRDRRQRLQHMKNHRMHRGASVQKRALEAMPDHLDTRRRT